MAFFDRARTEKNVAQVSHPALNAVKRLFQVKGIQLDDRTVAAICSSIPQVHLLECVGSCKLRMAFVGNPSAVCCPQCGQLMKLIPDNLPEDSFVREGPFPKEVSDIIAGLGYFYSAMPKFQAGDLDGALASLDQAIRHRPDYIDAYYNRSEVRIAKEDYRGAVQDCDKVLQLQPNDADAYLNRGSAKSQLNDHLGALSDADKALALGFKNPIAHFNRAVSLLNLQRFVEARQALERFIQLAPRDPRTEQAKAWLELYCEGARQDELQP